jgi:hypothetical protein
MPLKLPYRHNLLHPVFDKDLFILFSSNNKCKEMQSSNESNNSKS